MYCHYFIVFNTLRTIILDNYIQENKCEITTFIFIYASFVNKKMTMVVVNRQKYLLFREEIEVKKRGCSIFTLQPIDIVYVFNILVLFVIMYKSHIVRILCCYFVTVLLPQAIAWEKFSPKFLPI